MGNCVANTNIVATQLVSGRVIGVVTLRSITSIHIIYFESF